MADVARAFGAQPFHRDVTAEAGLLPDPLSPNEKRHPPAHDRQGHPDGG
jgi:hypothetical protein